MAELSIWDGGRAASGGSGPMRNRFRRAQCARREAIFSSLRKRTGLPTPIFLIDDVPVEALRVK